MRKITAAMVALATLSACASPNVAEQETVTRKRVADFPKPKYALHKSRPTTQAQTAQMIKEEAKRQGVPEHFALAVAYVESGINPNTRNSWAGAIGVLQVMPGTARQFDPTLTKEQMRDPRINIPLGIAYLKLALNKTGNNLHSTAAKYEAGLYSRRTRSVYSNKVMVAHNNSVVIAHLRGVPDYNPLASDSAWASLSSGSVKDQSRVGQSKAFPVPIGSLVYDPVRFAPVMLSRDGGDK